MRLLALIVSFSLPMLRLQASDYSPPHLSTWSDLDSYVTDKYASFTNDACIYPDGSFKFGLNGGMFTFSPAGDFAAQTNALALVNMLGLPTYQMTVVETTQDTSRVWLSEGTNGVALHTNAVPLAFDSEEWVRIAYRHAPPDYLSGANLAQWYADRDRCRFFLTMTLVNSNAWPTLQDALQAAATNAPAPEAPPPTAPADSNQLAFAGIQTSQTNMIGLWLYSPSNRPVAMLSRPTLTMTTNAWNLLGELTATPPFEYYETPRLADIAFYFAGFSDEDADNDGIPDILETYVFGTNPNSADSDGDGVSDYNEIYIFGTDPWNPDTSPPAVSIVSPAADEWKAVLP